MSVKSETSAGIVGLFVTLAQSIDVFVFTIEPISIELPLDIAICVPFSDNVCGTPWPPCPAFAGGEATQVEPLYVRTSPVLPATVRLSDKTAVPWNVSA